jgi:hypothetical protein
MILKFDDVKSKHMDLYILFIYGSLSNINSSSYVIVFNGGIASEKLIGKDLQH